MNELLENTDIGPDTLKERKFAFVKSKNLVERLKRWAQSDSIWPLVFGDSCCTNEYMQSYSPEYKTNFRKLDNLYFSPSLSDLLIIAGPINYTLLPELISQYNEMKSPKWVMALGACAISGGPFSESYNIVTQIEKHIPIDIYIPGCPPKPSEILEGIETLKKCIRDGEFVNV